MDVEALATFLAVHKHRSFSDAAQALHRTQPAISHRILLLERELGAPLFERLASGIALSQAGATLLPYAERVLAAMKDAEDAVRALCTEHAGPVTLAIVGSLAGPKLMPVLAQFATAHPGVDLRLRTARSVEVSDLVRRAEATLGLRYGPDATADLESEAIGAETLLVVCGRRHSLAGTTLKALTELRSERWLGFAGIPGQREIAATHISALFAARGLEDIDWTAVDSLTAQKRLVEAGFGLALLPEDQIADERAAGTLGIIGVEDLQVRLPIHLVTRKDGFLSLAARKICALLKTSYGAKRQV